MPTDRLAIIPTVVTAVVQSDVSTIIPTNRLSDCPAVLPSHFPFFIHSNFTAIGTTCRKAFFSAIDATNFSTHISTHIAALIISIIATLATTIWATFLPAHHGAFKSNRSAIESTLISAIITTISETFSTTYVASDNSTFNATVIAADKPDKSAFGHAIEIQGANVGANVECPNNAADSAAVGAANYTTDQPHESAKFSAVAAPNETTDELADRTAYVATLETAFCPTIEPSVLSAVSSTNRFSNYATVWATLNASNSPSHLSAIETTIFPSKRPTKSFAIWTTYFSALVSPKWTTVWATFDEAYPTAFFPTNFSAFFSTFNSAIQSPIVTAFKSSDGLSHLPTIDTADFEAFTSTDGATFSSSELAANCPAVKGPIFAAFCSALCLAIKTALTAANRSTLKPPLKSADCCPSWTSNIAAKFSTNRFSNWATNNTAIKAAVDAAFRSAICTTVVPTFRIAVGDTRYPTNIRTFNAANKSAKPTAVFCSDIDTIRQSIHQHSLWSTLKSAIRPALNKTNSISDHCSKQQAIVIPISPAYITTNGATLYHSHVDSISNSIFPTDNPAVNSTFMPTLISAIRYSDFSSNHK